MPEGDHATLGRARRARQAAMRYIMNRFPPPHQNGNGATYKTHRLGCHPLASPEAPRLVEGSHKLAGQTEVCNLQNVPQRLDFRIDPSVGKEDIGRFEITVDYRNRGLVVKIVHPTCNLHRPVQYLLRRQEHGLKLDSQAAFGEQECSQ